jgi:hypothetical protein
VEREAMGGAATGVVLVLAGQVALLAGCWGEHLLGTFPDGSDAGEEAEGGDVAGPEAADGDGEASDGETSEGETSDGAGDDDGHGADAGGGLTVLVGRFGWGTYPEGALKPVAGAQVALDLPGGERRELRTDPEGLAEFGDVDLSSGEAGVIAHAAGYSAVGRVGLGAADREVTLVLDAFAPPVELVEVFGTAQHAVPGGCLYVTATIPHLGVQCVAPPDYALHVVSDTPFTLVSWLQAWASGLEPRGFEAPMLAWTRLDHPGVGSPARVDVDFADGAVPTRVSGSFALPSAAASLLAAYGRGDVLIGTAASGAVLGRATRTSVSGDGRAIEYELEFLELSEVEDPQTLFVLWLPEAGEATRSVAVVEGYPGPGRHDPGFLEPPGFATVRPRLHGPLRWESYDTGVHPAVSVPREGEAQALIQVYGPVDATSLTIPGLPSSVDEGELLGSGPLELVVGAFRPDAGGVYAERQVEVGPFAIER